MVFMLPGMTPLLQIRLSFGKTQAAMAAIAGVDQATWSRWERAMLDPTLAQIARVRAYALRHGIEWSDGELFTAASKPNGARLSSQKRGASLT